MPRRKVNVREKIKEALKKEPLTWTQLWKEAQVSKGALSRHLDWLVRRKIVLTSVIERRPPTTVYSLAKEPFVNLVSFLTEGMTNEQAEHFLNKILTQKVCEVMEESYNEILEKYLFINPLSPFEINIRDMLDSIGISEPILKGKRFYKHGLGTQDLLGVNLKNMTKKERVAFVAKEIWFGPPTVQIISTMYQIEKHILDNIPQLSEKQRHEMMQSGDLHVFNILPLVQKHNAWEDFDRFSKWWREEITPKIPSAFFLIWIARNMTYFITQRI